MKKSVRVTLRLPAWSTEGYTESAAGFVWWYFQTRLSPSLAHSLLAQGVLGTLCAAAKNAEALGHQRILAVRVLQALLEQKIAADGAGGRRGFSAAEAAEKPPPPPSHLLLLPDPLPLLLSAGTDAGLGADTDTDTDADAIMPQAQRRRSSRPLVSLLSSLLSPMLSPLLSPLLVASR